MYIDAKYTGVAHPGSPGPLFYLLSLTFEMKIGERKKDRVSYAGILCANMHSCIHCNR